MVQCTGVWYVRVLFALLCLHRYALNLLGNKPTKFSTPRVCQPIEEISLYVYGSLASSTLRAREFGVEFSPNTVRSRFAASPLFYESYFYIFYESYIHRATTLATRTCFFLFFCRELIQGTTSPRPVRTVPLLRLVVRSQSNKIPWLIAHMKKPFASVVVLL